MELKGNCLCWPQSRMTERDNGSPSGARRAGEVCRNDVTDKKQQQQQQQRPQQQKLQEHEEMLLTEPQEQQNKNQSEQGEYLEEQGAYETQQQLMLWNTPPAFRTPAQLLHVRLQLFCAHQSQFRSCLAFLPMHAYILEHHCAVVGHTSQPHLTSFFFTDADPLAYFVLSLVAGTPVWKRGGLSCATAASVSVEEKTLLDQLDLAMCLGGGIPLQRGLVSDAMVNIFVNSVLQKSSAVAHLAFCSARSLLQAVLDPSTVQDVVPATTAEQGYRSAIIPSHAWEELRTPFYSQPTIPIPAHSHSTPFIPFYPQPTVPVPFSRIVDILNQHLYWIPATQAAQLLQEQHPDTASNYFTCGPRDVVDCVTVKSLNLIDLVEWYQSLAVCSLIPQEAMTPDTERYLASVFNFS